ncbi:phosphotransferase [bacterium]|nr:phosphotransferase [bacterium]
MQSFTDEQLNQIAEKHLNVSAQSITKEPITTGLFNRSYFLVTQDVDYVLRIAPPRDSVFLFYEREMMRQEPEVHRLVREKTGTPVADIIVFDDSREIIPNDYIIMVRLPGTPMTFASSYSEESVLKQVGSYMAQVHKIRAEQYGYLGAHRPMEPQNAWVDAFRVMWEKQLDDIIATGHYNAEEKKAFMQLLEDNIRHFERPAPSCLLHMDLWNQNILVDGMSYVTGIIDWDRALWGDPEMEFAVLDYCGMAKGAFWEGYGQKRDVSESAHVRQVFYYLYELQKYIVIEQGRKEDPAMARRYKEHVVQVLRHATRL